MNRSASAGAGTPDVAHVYDRIARIYDWFEAPMDQMGGKERRRRLLSRAAGRRSMRQEGIWREIVARKA